MNSIYVTTQEELDTAINDARVIDNAVALSIESDNNVWLDIDHANIIITVKGANVTALEGSNVVADHGSHVVACTDSNVTAYRGSFVRAMSGSRVAAYSGSYVIADGMDVTVFRHAKDATITGGMASRPHDL